MKHLKKIKISLFENYLYAPNFAVKSTLFSARASINVFKKSLLVFSLLTTFVMQSQTVTLSGKVIANDDVEGIHIINKTASKYTTTGEKGEFEIPATLNDTIIVSGVKYLREEIVISQNHINSKSLEVNLTENVNELNEVVVGKILSGDLTSDIKNSDVERDINFYDVGIPGYTGKPKTQSERRLYEAQTGSGLIPLNPILNWISGRTKRLKHLIELERQDIQMNRAISEFSEMLFEIDDLDEAQRVEFFYFSSEDPEFMQIAKEKNDIKLLEFLQIKLKAYKANVNSSQD